MPAKQNEKTADTFWKEFEEETGEKVLEHSLGKYISGWDEFDENKWNNIWGLLITTTGGFRFHHFPQSGWIDALTRFADSRQAKEKTFFVPQEKIVSKQLIKETKWYKKLLGSDPPKLIINYTDSGDKRLLFDVEHIPAKKK